MYKLIILTFIILFAFSCSTTDKKPEYIAEPETLEELFRWFSPAEVTPEIIESEKKAIIVVATGHLYPLLNYPEAYNTLIDTIINQKPDYFFSLGDIVYNNSMKEWDTVKSYLNRLNTRVFFAPGNHDLNYHYERYFGKRDNQIEAELRYLNQVGYRYKILKDNFSNYVFINANDSIDRVLNFLNIARSHLDNDKHMILLSSQALWFKKHQDAEDPKTWVNKPFKRDEILPKIENYEYLIHGDWGGNFYRGKQKNSKGFFDVMAVGNRKVGDTLFISRLTIFEDTIMAYPVKIELPPDCDWYADKKVKKK